MTDFSLRISPGEAADILEDYVVGRGLSTECVDRYHTGNGNGPETVVLVFEKYFMRNSSRASLTVVIDNASGRTKVHAVGSGGGQGLIFRFDWGAAEGFADLAREALREYMY